MELIAETKSKHAREAIERRAYRIWEQEGRPEGRALENWTQAEAELFAAGQLESVRAEVASNSLANSSQAPRSRYGLVLRQDRAA